MSIKTAQIFIENASSNGGVLWYINNGQGNTIASGVLANSGNSTTQDVSDGKSGNVSAGQLMYIQPSTNATCFVFVKNTINSNSNCFVNLTNAGNTTPIGTVSPGNSFNQTLTSSESLIIQAVS